MSCGSSSCGGGSLSKKLTPEQYHVTQEAGTEEVLLMLYKKIFMLFILTLNTYCYSLTKAIHREIQ